MATEVAFVTGRVTQSVRWQLTEILKNNFQKLKKMYITPFECLVYQWHFVKI